MKQKLNLKWLKYLLSKHILAFIFANFLVGLSLYAQERTITGTVRDNSGETLVGVNIVIKGTTLGTASGIDGTYSLKIMDNSSILTVNYIGFKTQEISVGGQSIINITMEKDVLGIDEVVVVGYGVQKKKLVTGATVQVKNEEFTKNNSVRIENALQGLTPGMSIVKQSGQPGSDYNITIRGLFQSMVIHL